MTESWTAKLGRALRVSSEVARQAGQWVVAELPKLELTEISEKGPSDFVTRLDKGSEKMILDRLRKEFPGDAILSEEEGGGFDKAEYAWIVDPLDGTNNLVHRIPRFCVSIALLADGRPVVAAVYDPTHDELYACKRDEGVWLNGKPIGVSTTTDPMRGYVATGLPARHRDLIPGWLEQFGRVAVAFGTTRKTGAAVMDLANVACGRMDGYFEPKLAPWDMAAGSLLVEAGGGIVTDEKGDPWSINSNGIIAANPDLHPLLLKAIKG